MTEITGQDIASVIGGIVAQSNLEIETMTRADLERHWHFKWDEKASLVWNFYQFNDMLHLYKSFCRRWEERHYGCACIVERVRDAYLMPKIVAFIADLKQHIIEEPR